MTNEKKAKEIAERWKKDYWLNEYEPSYSESECYMSAMNMAQWKDEQFKQYLLQKRDGLKWRSDIIGKYHDVCTELMDEIIKDLGL